MQAVAKTQWSKIQVIAIARALSLLGTELTIFSLVFREKDMGASAVAALLIVGTLPAIIFAPWSGSIADRYSTKTVIPIAYVVASLAIFAQTLELDHWATLLLLFIASTCGTVISPTWGKLIPTLTTKEDLGRAMGTTQTYFAFAGLLGPSVAGILVKQTGFFWTFVIDGTMTLMAASIPFLVKVNFKPGALEEGEKTDVVAGFKFLVSNKLLRALVLLIFFLVLTVGIINVGDVFLITDILGGDSLIYGLVGSGFAVGTLAFSAFAGIKKLKPKTELRLLGIGFGFLSLAAIVVGQAPNYWVVMAVWAIAGAANATLNTYGVAMMIKVIPHEVQGRVFAAFGALVSVASIGSMSLGGVLVDAIGVREVFMVAGVFAIAAVIVLFPGVYRAQRANINAENTVTN